LPSGIPADHVEADRARAFFTRMRAVRLLEQLDAGLARTGASRAATRSDTGGQAVAHEAG